MKMRSIPRLASFIFIATAIAGVTSSYAADELRAGFAEVDITPDLEGKSPVWIAGYGMNRKATGVHDPIMARCVVLQSGSEKIALVSVDLIGLQYSETKRIRAALADYRYVMVASTHNHEGPDVIGIWGRNPFSRGVSDEYLSLVVARVVALVKQAAAEATPVEASFGTAVDESLLGDNRRPIVKDGVLRVLQFRKLGRKEPAGLLVQWNCHPEALGSRNTLLTADFPHYTVARLKERYQCPVVYVSGAVGGLMAPPGGNVVKNEAGKVLEDGNFEYTRQYGLLVADLAAEAVDADRPILLTPFQVAAKPVAIPLRNSLYRLAHAMGVLKREARAWSGDAEKVGLKQTVSNSDGTSAVETEVACLRLGELHIACLPGEVYPELVYGQFQNPVEAGADFPDAPLEPTVKDIIPGEKWLLIGLANDEIGYIIPRRQWDAAAPYAYGRKESQYGEINSCGHDVAPLLMQALQRRVRELSAAE